MSNRPINVLLVEDNLEHVELIRKLLSQDGETEYAVESFQTLQAGIERLCESKVDIVLLDLELPDSAGIETFYKLHSSAPDTAIVVLTGTNDEALAIETVQRGAQDYLVKGRVDRFWLRRSLQYSIERKRVQEELRQARDEMEDRVRERTAELADANEKLLREVEERRRAEMAVRESNSQLGEALERLRETQQAVIQRERLHALGRMASGIAHDFNNSLSPILGFSEMLLADPKLFNDQAKVREYLEFIRTAAQDGAKVVARLKDFFRPRHTDEVFRPVRLEKLVREVIALMQPRWKDQAMAAGVTIRMETDLPASMRISGDEAELREMLANLVFNSVDAITEHGTITFRGREEEGRIILEVSDSGSGMTEEVRVRCMEPFFSTKCEHGTGLGLGIVYGIVLRHEGKIDISSEEGQGTTVKVSFPKFEGSEDPEKNPEALPPVGRLRLLVVEDEPLVREVIGIYLVGDGHDVVTAENGLDGLQKFEAGQFDVVLTDRAMPEMNGDQLAVAIKERNPAMPVVLLTGFGDAIEGEGETVPGVDVVLSKPFNVKSLREALGRSLGR